MKVLLIVPLFPPDYDGGMELSAQSIAVGLRARGIDLHVATSTFRERFQGERTEPEWVHRIYRFPLPFQHHTSRMANKLETFAAMRRVEDEIDRNRDATEALLENHRFDVVYAFDTQQIGNGTVEPLLDRGIPVVWNVSAHHMLEALRPKRTHRIAQRFLPRTRRSIQRPDYSKMAFISRFMRDQYAAHGLVAQQDWITYRGLPEEQIRTEPLAHDSTFRVVGRHTWSKGFHVAVAAAAILQRTRPELTWQIEFIGAPGDGDATYVEELRQTVGREGLASRVTFVGKLPHGEVLRRISSSVACIVPSVWDEPFGRTVIEAMAANVPLIAARTGAIPEMVEDGESALLYERESPEALASHMVRVLEEPELRARMRTSGLDLVRSRYALEAVLESTHDMLYSVVGTAQVPKP